MPHQAELVVLLRRLQELTDCAVAELDQERRDDFLARRADLVRTLERPLSLRLDRLEQRYPGSAIARVADDACPHCRIQVPTATLCRIQRREAVETCSKRNGGQGTCGSRPGAARQAFLLQLGADGVL
jgi:predicted  nucleic acid-binding Zn-ribbon protein